jgi:hypothetical protein
MDQGLNQQNNYNYNGQTYVPNNVDPSYNNNQMNQNIENNQSQFFLNQNVNQISDMQQNNNYEQQQQQYNNNIQNNSSQFMQQQIPTAENNLQYDRTNLVTNGS